MPKKPLTYDSLEAEQYIAERTGLSREAVSKFMDADFRYMQLLGLCGPDGTAEEVEAERRLHADLMPDEGGRVYWPLLLAYVERVTGIDANSIANMMAEDTAYYVKQRLTHRDAYPACRAWADSIIAERAGARPPAEYIN